MYSDQNSFLFNVPLVAKVCERLKAIFYQLLKTIEKYHGFFFVCVCVLHLSKNMHRCLCQLSDMFDHGCVNRELLAVCIE